MTRYILIALISVGASCQASDLQDFVVTKGRDCVVSDALKNYVSLSAAEHFEVAIAKSDLRYIQVLEDAGVGMAGVPLSRFECLKYKNIIRNNPIVTDIVDCKEQAELQTKAVKISAEFNQLIAREREKKNEQVCNT